MSAVVKFPTGRLSRKRQAEEKHARAFWDGISEEYRPIMRAMVYLLAASNASEFAKERKRVILLAGKLRSETKRAYVLQTIAGWRPDNRANVVVRLMQQP